MASILGFHDLHPTTKRLLLARSMRSVGQGMLVVDFALYLHALNWNAVAIGLLLTSSSLFGALLTLLIGASSDRLKRKPFLLAYEAVVFIAGFATFISTRTLILSGAAIVAGFGRGAGGAAGPFSPAEQAWLAEEVPTEARGRVYSLNAALGFFGMGLGAVTAALPGLWGSYLPGSSAYRPLFLLVGLAAIGCLILLGGAGETYHRPVPKIDLEHIEAETGIRRQENRLLRKLVLINSFNGFAIGLTGPLMSYWFALRFHVGPEAIGPVMGATFFLTGFMSLFTGRLSERIGIVSSVVWARLIGLVLLILLPLMPHYGLAALCYLLRSAFTRGSAGAQQALVMGLVQETRRGLAASLNAAAMQLPRSVGPTIAGYLLSIGLLAAPFYAAAALQGVYVMLYDRFFRLYEPPVVPRG
ncbi:MAG: MFS transporter [Desulfomonilaceae bacterium]